MAVDVEPMQGLEVAAPKRRGAYAGRVARIALLSVATVALWAAAGGLLAWNAQRKSEGESAASSEDIQQAQIALRRVDDTPEVMEASPIIAMATVSEDTVSEDDAVAEPIESSAPAVEIIDAPPPPSSIQISAPDGASVEVAGVRLEPYWEGRQEEDAPMAEVVSISPDSSLIDALCVGDAIVTVGGSSLSGLTSAQLAESFDGAVIGERTLDLALLTPPAEEGGERRTLQVKWGGEVSAGLENRSVAVDRRDCPS